MASDDASRSGRRREQQLWRWSALLFFVALASWALAVPLFTGSDESAHAIRAAAVVRGQPVGGPGISFGDYQNVLVEVDVPEAYALAQETDDCFPGRQRGATFGNLHTPRIQECPPFDGGSARVPVQTYEQRGQPLFYGLVGLPTLVFPAETGVYLMRIVNAAVCAAFLASACVSAMRLRRRRLVTVALCAAITPEALYLGGTVNSGGLEIASGLCLWTSGLALVRGHGPVDPRLVARTGLSLVVFVLARGFSPIYALVAGLALLAVAERGRVRALLARTDVRTWLGSGAIAALASGAWLLMIHDRLPLTERPGSGIGHATRELPWFVQQAVGVFGFNDVIPPMGLALLWSGVVVAVVAVALGGATARDRAVVLALAACAFALSVSAEGFSFPPTGFFWQGRYVLPLLMGCVVAAAAVADGRPRARVPSARASGVGALVLLVILHAWAFTYALRHYTVGPDGTIDPIRVLLDPEWSPRYGPPWLFATAFTTAVAGAAALLWREASRDAGSALGDQTAGGSYVLATTTGPGTRTR